MHLAPFAPEGPPQQIDEHGHFHGVYDVESWDILQLDGALQFLPWRDLVLESLRKGEVPIWNPYTYGGTPLMANSQSAPLYPLHLLWSATPLGAEELLAFSAWLHLFIAAAGMFLLTRRLGASRLGAVLAATGFPLSAFMVAWIQLPSVVMTAAWIPWCLLGVARIFSVNGSVPIGRAVPSLAVPVAFLFLAGHLQIAAYGILAATCAAVWFASAKLMWKPLLAFLISIAVGGMIAAPQLLPVIENGRVGHRSAPPTPDGWIGYNRQSLELKHLAAAVSPYKFGMPNEHTEDGATSYWLARVDKGRHYAEQAFYVGPVILALALIGLFRRRQLPVSGLFGILGFVSVFAALGTPLTKAMYFWLPGWAATGSPGRIAILFSISACVLAALAFPQEEEDTSPFRVWLPLFALGAVAAFLLFISPIPSSDDLYLSPAIKSIAFCALFALGGVAAGFAFLKSKYRNTLKIGLVGLSVLGLGVAHMRMNPGAPRGEFRHEFAGSENLVGHRVAVHNDEWSFFGPTETLIAPPNSLLPYRIEEITGYDSLTPARTKARLDDINGQDSAPPVNGNMMFLKTGFDIGKLAAAGVDLILSSRDLPYDALFKSETWGAYIVPNPAPRQFTASFSRIRLNPNAEAAATELEAFGWKQRPDGEGGVLEYRPTSYLTGLLLMMLGLGAVSLLYWSRVGNDDADR